MRASTGWLRIGALGALAFFAAIAAAEPSAGPVQSTDGAGAAGFRLYRAQPSAFRAHVRLATSGDAAGADAATESADVVFWDAFEQCGNGAIDGGEACDRDNLGGQTCSSAGFTAGTLSCTRQCQLDTSQCTGRVCVVSTCNSDADCGPAQCGPCFLNICTGFQGN